MNNKRIADIIAKALAILENPDRWTQGVDVRAPEGRTYRSAREVAADSQAQVCMRGALFCAGLHENELFAHKWEVFNLVVSHLPLPYTSIAEFNDDPNTTHEDVVLVLKKALYSVTEIDD